MKKSDQIIGLPIISIADGKEVGIVKELVVDRKAGELAGLLIDGSRWYNSARLLPFSAIIGLGEHAITVEKETDVLDVEGSKNLEKTLSESIRVIGSKVLTKYGQLKGRILQFVIDETGKIVVCEAERLDGGIFSIPIQQVITFGEKVTVVLDDITESNIKHPLSEKAESRPNSNSVAESNVVQQNSLSKNMVGKHSTSNIKTDTGIVIVESGEEITEEIVKKAKLANKFTELQKNYR
ncbi:MAG: PRC-barrel domain-containing protein [Negativicutes bacterium]|jgi:uncharacterized protein YrrD